MKDKFNGGKPYHGSENISKGKLKGETDTDYFYFYCPRCEGTQVMRLLDYTVHEEKSVNPYDERMKSKAAKGFTIAFKIHCEKCGITDFVKLSNLGWQGGNPKDSRAFA